MAKVATREDKLGNLLKMEQGKGFGYCRETRSVTLTPTSDIGDVLVPNGANLQLVAVAGAANASAILIDPSVVSKRPATGTANVELAVLVRGPAVVAEQALTFAADIDTPAEVSTVLGALADLGIVARKQV